MPSLQGQESAQERRIQSSDSPCCFCLLLTERSVILPKPDRSFNNTILQKMNRLTQRHRKFLKRFKRSRDRWEPHSQLCDIQRMRQIESASIGLTIYFLAGRNHWIESLLEPALSWMTFFGMFTFGFVLYMLHEFYWIQRSVSYMIERRVQNIAELGIEEAEQAAS